MYRRDFGRFSRYVNKYLLFFRFTDFSRSCRYFSSIVIPINFYHVECGDGRQPRILVENFWIPRSKTRTFSTPGFLTKAMLLLFFALVRAFAFFLFKAKTTLLVLWIFTSNISPHFAEIEDHKRKVDTNGFVSEIHQIWKDLMLLDSPNVHPPLKNNQRKKANFKCKWCISLVIEHALNLGSN